MLKHELLTKYGVKVLSATQPIADDDGGELYEMIIEWKDEKYSRDLSVRVKDGIDTSVERGTFCGGYLIYGYKKVNTDIVDRKGNYKKRITIDEEQAKIIKLIFEEYGKGTEKKDIADLLNEKGHRLNGKPFKSRHFDRWLSNDKYTGEFSFGERKCDTMYPQLIDKALFDKVQERLKANAYFSGSNTAREPYLLTGKAKCGHCDTDMVSDGGTGKLGTTYHYYACKLMKKRNCDKKRENKNDFELTITERVTKYLRKSQNLNRIADDLMNHYELRTGNDGVRSIEVQIIKAEQDVDKFATAFIEAKSNLLRANIEKKMQTYEILLKDLQMRKATLELERGLKLTKQDILDYVANLIEGDTQDKEYQRKIIDNLISVVYISDSDLVVYLDLKGGNEVVTITLEDTNKAKQCLFNFNSVQTLSPPPRHPCDGSELDSTRTPTLCVQTLSPLPCHPCDGSESD